MKIGMAIYIAEGAEIAGWILDSHPPCRGMGQALRGNDGWWCQALGVVDWLRKMWLGTDADWGCAMKPVVWVLSGIMVLAVVGCGGGGPQVEERPEARPAPSPLPTVAATPVPTATVSAGTQLSIAVGPVRSDIPKYDRGEWRHWADEDGDCQDARQESLIAESETSVTYTNDDRCRVASGSWAGPYTGEAFTDPRLAGHRPHGASGERAPFGRGGRGARIRSASYANDLTYDGHLIAVKASANRSKGSNGPEFWKPPERAYWCRYAVDWITIKNDWELTATGTGGRRAGADAGHPCEPSQFACGRPS